MPFQFADYTIAISGIVFSDGTIVPADLSTNTEVKVRAIVAFPGGVRADPRVTAIAQLHRPGHLAIGERVFALLMEVQWGFEDGHLELHPAFADTYHGVWIVKSGKAVSVDPRRTLPPAELEARVREGRRIGKDPARDVGTAVSLIPG